MLKTILVRALIVALGAAAPTTTYTSTGIYYADTESVVDANGEEWGYDAELADGTPVIITFDSQNTTSRYDDEVVSLTPVEQ